MPNAEVEKIFLQNELSMEREKQASLLQNIPGGVTTFRLKKDGHVCTEYVSDGLEKLCGYGNGKQTMELIESCHDLDAVITDIQMPEMDGIELIQRIRQDKKFRHIAIIANTQFGDPEQEEKLLALGASDFVYKPTTPKIVEIRVRNALKR